MPSINLDLDYPDHPKTRRLVGILGRGAEAMPIRLWCYCGKYHRNDGSLSSYATEEIEALLDWHGEPGKAIQALVRVGFLDRTPEGLFVHDWEEHAGHLLAYHEAAKAGAKARWNKRLPRELRQAPAPKLAPKSLFDPQCDPECDPHSEPHSHPHSDPQSSSHSDQHSGPQCDEGVNRNAVRNAPALQFSSLQVNTKEGITSAVVELVETWNSRCGPELPAVRPPLSSGRERHARARLAEVPDMARWAEAVARLARSKFATGHVPGKDGGKPWRADFDFLVKPDSLAKIEEGKYDDRVPPPPPPKLPEVGKGAWKPETPEEIAAMKALRGEA